MTSRAAIDDFLKQRKLAIVGVSSKKRKFGNIAYKELEQKGYEVFLVHPNAESINGDQCWSSLTELPEPVGGLLVIVPPAETERVVREAASAGISRVWMQQGAQSEEAIRFCEDNGISVVHGECILMFAEPVGFLHRLHRWIWGILGKLPK